MEDVCGPFPLYFPNEILMKSEENIGPQDYSYYNFIETENIFEAAK